jgi:hypothetical protein
MDPFVHRNTTDMVSNLFNQFAMNTYMYVQADNFWKSRTTISISESDFKRHDVPDVQDDPNEKEDDQEDAQ